MDSAPSATGPIRLLLVEDHAQVAMALDAAFETVPDIELVARAKGISDAVPAAGEHQPDVVLLDRRLPDGDGIDAIALLHEQSPGCRVLVFTGGADRAVADRVAAAGGAGLLLKAGLLEDLLDTIRRVAAGEDSFDVDLPGRPARR
ncbi:response regulator transcription factor [Amycolatopsis pithecellobii]|uniref:response regulator transcription factor n=1 Tax=Amycolatopsis pithecellobii TaxID=664692 RepID=UPI0028AFA077|nr:response regulator [Amycolatopsis pithecellobii]